MIKNFLFPATCTIAAGLAACTSQSSDKSANKPNIIIIYCDDLGYGDIGVNGAIGVSTPNIDRLAKNGLNFTDAHCTAATSTPSRYSLLTGRYAFRNNAAILPGDAPLLIDPNKGTIASMLQKAGYKTGVVGKWHLGLGIGKINWNEEIKPGPREIGFDYSFLLPATGDRVPCVFVENQKVVGLDPEDPVKVSYSDRLDGYPLGSEHPELLKVLADPQHSQSIINGVSRIGFMEGGKNALWIDENFPYVFTGKAKDFILNNRDNKFFLYFALPFIHVPRITHADFEGKSTMGPRGDAIVMADWCVEQITDLVDSLGISENTMIIFSSDNGPVLNDGYSDKAEELIGDHKPSGPFKGGKYSAFEAGTRMPTIVYWPGTVKPAVSNALVSQIDLYASIAKLTGQEIAEGDAGDSRDYLDTWLGKSDKGRDFMLEEAFTFALRYDKWKYIHPVENDPPDWFASKKIESGLSRDVQLYDIQADPAESRNVADQNPEAVKKIQEILSGIRNNN